MAGTLAAGTYRSSPLPLALGTNVITVVAYDSSNNPSATQTATVIRDNQAPMVDSKTSLADPITWVRGGMITVEWRLRDNHMISMVYDDRSQVIAPSSPGIYRVDALYKAGRNAVAIRATDSAGNELYDTIFFETKLLGAENHLYRIREMPDTNVWMAQNLRSTPPTQPTAPVSCYSGDCEANGWNYAWAGAMNLDPQYNRAIAGLLPSPARGICPDGWHVPTYEEWQSLFFAVARTHGLAETMDNGVHLLKTTGDGWHRMARDASGTESYTYYPGLDRYEGFIDVNFSNSGIGGAITGAQMWLPFERTATQSEYLHIGDGATIAQGSKSATSAGLRCVADR